MKKLHQIGFLLLTAGAVLPSAAQVNEPARLPVVVSFLSTVNVAPADGDDLASGWGTTTDAAVLGDLRGGTDIITTEATLRGTVGNNTATNVTSGMNVISGGSFANSSGLPVVIQNSGANVLIQNATVINLQLQ
ncbi:hypothetical protein RCH14_002620 [Massilia sp. MP_M2]|uniref:hypothetical protein n=1 Tax=Massilia sp. MP_M2 TaxID=3071713 RepID=UPI00319E1E50